MPEAEAGTEPKEDKIRSWAWQSVRMSGGALRERFPDEGLRAIRKRHIFARSSFGTEAVMKMLFSVLVVLIAIGHYRYEDLFSEIFITLLFIAAFPWFLPFLAKKMNLQAVDFFGAKFTFLEHEICQQSKRIDQLFLLSMSENTFRHLEKLGSDEGFGEFEVHPAFTRELSHLENLGYIRFKQPLKGLDDFMKLSRDDSLSRYIELTARGMEFLRLRQKISITQAPSDS